MAVIIGPSSKVIVSTTPPQPVNVVTTPPDAVNVIAPSGLRGPPGPQGEAGTSVNIVGSVPTAAALPPLTAADAGSGYITEDDGHLHVWDGDSWTDVGSIQGPPGPPGPSSIGARHIAQAVPTAVWVLVHGLGYFPNVTVVDTQGNQIQGNVHYDSADQITITFSAGFAGDAYLS